MEKNICTPIFIVELLTMAKTEMQHKHPSAEEWIKNMWYIFLCVCVCVCVYTHNGILLSYKKKEIMSFAATRVDLEINILSKSDRQISYDSTCM